MVYWMAAAFLLFCVGLGGGTTLALYLLSGDSSAETEQQAIRDPALDSEAIASSEDVAALSQALDYARLGDYGTAVTELTALSEGDPSSATAREALFLLGRTYYQSGDAVASAGALDRYLRDYPDGPDAARALMLRAESRVDLGQYADAQADLHRYVELNPPARSYAFLRMGDIASELGDGLGAIDSYTNALGGGLPGYTESLVMLKLVALHDGSGDLAGALTWAERVAVTTPSTRDRTNALRRVASLSRTLGDDERWRQVSLQLVREFPAYAVARDAMEDLAGAGYSVDPFLEAQLYSRQGESTRAEGILLNLVIQSDGETAARAAYELGLSRLALGDDEGALAWFEQAGRSEADWAEDLELKRLEAAVRLDRDGAEDDLEDFSSAHSGSLAGQQAATTLALAAGSEEEEVERWLVVMGEATATRDLAAAADAGRRAAELLAAADDEERAAEALGAAARIAPTSFAGLRADSELAAIGGDVDLPAYYRERDASTWLAGFTGVSFSEGARSPLAWRSGRELWALGLRRESTGHLRDVLSLARHDPYLLVQLASRAASDGQFPIAARAGGVLLENLSSDLRQDVPRSVGLLAYPRPFLDIAQAEAESRELDPLLLYAVIRQESFFDPGALSSAQARGLTQVIPSTAAGIASELGVADFTIERLFEPPLSLEFGAYYLAAQMDAFDDYAYAALAAYNGGPGNAQRWGGEGGFEDPDVFVSRIDFGETSNYVRMVMEHYANYRALYGGDSRPNLRGLQ